MSLMGIRRTHAPRWPWVLGGAALLAWLGAAGWPGDEATPTPAAPHPRFVAATAPVHAQMPAAPDAARNTGRQWGAETSAAAPVHCLYQHLDLTIGGHTLRTCVAATRVNQSGDIRSFVLEPQGTSGWRLVVEAVQGVVMAARLGGPGAAEYRCEGEACRGLSLGRRGADGARTLRSRGALLQPAAVGAATPVELNADLQVASDEHDPALACGDSKLTIARDGGGLRVFCPAGGVAMAMLDQGRRVFTLRSLEGEDLIVRVDAQGVVDGVEFDGLSCSATACAGSTVTMAAAVDAVAAGPVFGFAGTTLFGPVAGAGTRSSARVSGQVASPRFPP